MYVCVCVCVFWGCSGYWQEEVGWKGVAGGRTLWGESGESSFGGGQICNSGNAGSRGWGNGAIQGGMGQADGEVLNRGKT